MVRKKLAAAIAAIGALQAGVVSALGMGDFSLFSALNQPLEAEIRLLNAEDLDATQIRISLADPKDFENSGVSREFFLTNLRFNVEMDGRGGGVIKITTRDPVVEPYLNFLVEARWPSGRLLREYTVLLDLPVFSESASQSVASATSFGQPASLPAAKTTTSAPAVSSSSSPLSARQSLSGGELKSGEQYRVRSDDTLWEIALKSRPDAGVTVQQTMVGIQHLNPEAFINGNINRLKAGSVLRLPTADQISISDSQAIGEVASQNKAWRQGGDSDSTADAQLDATGRSGDSADSSGSEPRLSIATAGDSDQSSVGDGTGSGSGSQALKNELALAEENLDKISRENQEMQSRLGDMEAKMATLQRLIELKDDQLAALQGDVASREDQIDEGQAAAVDDVVDTLTDSEAVTTAVDEPVAAESKPASAIDKPKPVPAPAEPESLDEILGNPLYQGAAGLLLLAIIGLLVMRRRKANEEEEFEQDLELEEGAEPFTDITLGDEVDLEIDSVADQEPEEDATDQLVAELEQQIAEDSAAEAAAAQAAEEAAPAVSIEAQTGDAIAEADIYVAYGRYQQAVDLLRPAIAQEPERADLQVKLLEIYIETRDKPDFQKQYLALQQLGDEAAVVQVKEMLSSVEGVADWLDDLPGTGDFSDADMDADLIEGLDDVALDDADDLIMDDDLEIDLELDEGPIISTQEFEAISLDEDSGFDLSDDLDLDLDLDLDAEVADDSKTMQFDAVSLDSEESGLSVDAEDDSVEDNLDLDLDGELDLDDLEDTDLSDLEAEFGERAEQPSEASIDLGDTDLSDLEAEFGERAEQPSEASLDLGDTDLSGLEAELGERTEQPAEASLDLGELDLDDLDLDELELDTETSTDDLSLDDLTADFEDDSAAELELSEDLDIEPSADLDFDLTEAVEPELVPELAVEPEVDTEASFEPVVVSASTSSADDFDFLADTDEVATKLDLARAYIDMGDSEGARDILDEVKLEGTDEQKQEADALIARID